MILRVGRISGLFCVLSLAVAAGSSAAKPLHSSGAQPFAFTVTNLVGTAGAIEQQPGGTNPGPCLWTIDSNEMWQAVPATLDAGASAQVSTCLIADDAWHVSSVILHAASPDLVVMISFQPTGQTFQVTPVAVSDGYEYRGCVYGPAYSTVSLLPEIPGSNGGHGVATQITVTVSNPSSRASRKVYAEVEVGSHGYCRDPITDYFAAGGAVWRTGL